MNENRKLPDVPASALRDHGSDERIDTLWQRLENDLAVQQPRPRNAWLWAPAALVIVFGSGVLVGARWVRTPSRESVAVLAEPPAVGDETPRPGQPTAVQPGKPDEPTQSKDKRNVAPGHPNTTGPELDPPSGAPDPALPPTASLPPVSASPEWQTLASSDYKAAFQALDRQGGFDAVLAKASSAEQLMTLSDVARANRQPTQAIKALRAVIERYASDPRAALAAWTLGDLLEKSGDRAGAAKAYATYRALSPQGDFAEDALARQIDAAIGEKNVDLAKQLAEQYAKDFPNGRRLSEIHARIGKLTGVDTGTFKGDASRSEDDTPWDEGDDEAPVPESSKQKSDKPATK
jgi:Tetratricopeptide repeat